MRFTDLDSQEFGFTRRNRIAFGLLLLFSWGRATQSAPQEKAGIWLDVPM